jgi:hypothetical protein
MSKDHKGFIVERDGKIYVRGHYTDGLGKRRELMRRADNRKHARQLRKELVKQINPANRGDQVTDIVTDKTTFAKVAERYEAVRLIPAEYVGDTKIAGLRSLRTPKAYLKRLVEHFGNARIRSITYSQVDEYRLKRLKEDVKIASSSPLVCQLKKWRRSRVTLSCQRCTLIISATRHPLSSALRACSTASTVLAVLDRTPPEI